jgi:hypothetical protein
MTRRAIRRFHRERAGLKRRHATAGAVLVPVGGSASVAPELPFDEDIDQVLASWWRATRMARRPNTAKN